MERALGRPASAAKIAVAGRSGDLRSGRHDRRGRSPGDGRRDRAMALTSKPARRRHRLIVRHPRRAQPYADGEAIGPADAPGRARGLRRLPVPVVREFARETLPGLVRTYVADGQLRIEERAIAFLRQDDTRRVTRRGRRGRVRCALRQVLEFADYLDVEPVGRKPGRVQSRPPGAMAERVGLELGGVRRVLSTIPVRGAIEARTAQALRGGDPVDADLPPRRRARHGDVVRSARAAPSRPGSKPLRLVSVLTQRVPARPILGIHPGLILAALDVTGLLIASYLSVVELGGGVP